MVILGHFFPKKKNLFYSSHSPLFFCHKVVKILEFFKIIIKNADGVGEMK
jgi:hypothetical protein